MKTRKGELRDVVNNSQLVLLEQELPAYALLRRIEAF
jgi:hypothetical protein